MVVFLIAFSVPATLREIQDEPNFTFLDVCMWFLVLMPLSLRFELTDLNSGTVFVQYDEMWWGISMSIVLIVGWGCFRPAIDVGFTWQPTRLDISVFFYTIDVDIVIGNSDSIDEWFSKDTTQLFFLEFIFRLDSFFYCQFDTTRTHVSWNFITWRFQGYWEKIPFPNGL
eukprot:TRINITY_DN5849_c0_g1_i2.p1 TRINITY_DN5849_c0_g1~~TRINITY_DN5849_c0_g1_i2.p1  ORF type:complete len:170 (-),score=14.11 TRINITY_DN5849_c0_g1_i2:79-588(-)